MENSGIGSEVVLSQPKIAPGRRPGQPNYIRGAARSVSRLKSLNYDPICSLVELYRKLEKEVELQEKIRDKIIVQLSQSGKPLAYRPEVHHALYDKLIKIGTDLLRYKYGRVPENSEETARALPPALLVQLTGEGQVYTVGEVDPTEEEPENEQD